jgi:hypothetical protein
MDKELKQEVFEYLDKLRESGITNMFGAAPYVQSEFGVDQKEARKLLSEWMRTFGEASQGGG